MQRTLLIFSLFAFCIILLANSSFVQSYEWGNYTVSDLVISGIDCDLEPIDACRSDDTMSLPEDTDCWINDTHKLILGANFPDNYNCRISLDAYFTGASEASEDIMVSVNGISRVWEDDDRGAGIFQVTIPNKFPFLKGANQIIISNPMFYPECINDTDHEDGQYNAGELNFGTIRIYACTSRDAPVINNIGINPLVPNETVEVEFYGSYSDANGDLTQRITFCIRESDNEIVMDCGMCQGGASISFDGTDGCNISVSETSVGDIFTCYLTVYDAEGMMDKSSITFEIGEGVLNSPPNVQIISPEEGAYFYYNRSILCKGKATDPEEGLLGEDDLRWSYIFKGTERTFDNSSYRMIDESWADLFLQRTGIYTIKLTATDSQGASAYDSVSIHVYNPLSFVYIPITKLDMIVGTPEYIKETLINDRSTEDTFHLELTGYQRAEFMTEGLNNIEFISPDERNISLRMDPFSSINVFVKVFSDDIGIFILNQTSISQNEQIQHSIRIISGYPPNFQEGGIFFVIILIALAVLVFGLFFRK